MGRRIRRGRGASRKGELLKGPTDWHWSCLHLKEGRGVLDGEKKVAKLQKRSLSVLILDPSRPREGHPLSAV